MTVNPPCYDDSLFVAWKERAVLDEIAVFFADVEMKFCWAGIVDIFSWYFKIVSMFIVIFGCLADKTQNECSAYI